MLLEMWKAEARTLASKGREVRDDLSTSGRCPLGRIMASVWFDEGAPMEEIHHFFLEERGNTAPVHIGNESAELNGAGAKRAFPPTKRRSLTGQPLP